MDLDLGHSAALGNELTSNTTLTEIRNPDVEKQTIAVAVLISVSCVVVVGIAVAAMVRRRQHRRRRVLEEERKAAAGGGRWRGITGVSEALVYGRAFAWLG
jgi:hypothetical protein